MQTKNYNEYGFLVAFFMNKIFASLLFQVMITCVFKTAPYLQLLYSKKHVGYCFAMEFSSVL